MNIKKRSVGREEEQKERCHFDANLCNTSSYSSAYHDLQRTYISRDQQCNKNPIFHIYNDSELCMHVPLPNHFFPPGVCI